MNEATEIVIIVYFGLRLGMLAWIAPTRRQ